METGTSMEATAAPLHSGPIEPAAPTPLVPASAAPRARITFFVVFTPLTDTGTSTLAVAQAPMIPAAAPGSPVTSTPTSGETMLPGKNHEWQDNDGEALFKEPPKKGNRPYGSLELKPPDIEIPEFGGGPHRKGYPLEF